MFSEALAEDICSRISLGVSLRSICECEGMPSIETIRLWKLKNPEFLAQYAQARQAQADYLSEECLSIADNSTPETAAVDRLRVDTRKWYAGKMHPRVYGESKGDTNVTVTNNVVVLTEDQQRKIQDRHREALGNV